MRKMIIGKHDDPALKQQLNVLTERVFGFSFARWDALGLWDSRYRAYAIAEAGQLQANVSVAEMALLIDGQPTEAIQIGAVATLPEARGQGLARELLEYVLQKYAKTPAFLFANRSVLDFYPRFGFRPMTEIQPFTQLERPLSGKPCQLLAPDDPMLRQRLESRQRYSAKLDVKQATWINLFHLLMGFPRDIYYLPQHDAIVIAQQEQETVLIYDVICGLDRPFQAIIPDLPFPGASQLEFAFTPDGLDVAYQEKPFTRTDDWGYLFGRNIDFGANSKFPHLCTT